MKSAPRILMHSVHAPPTLGGIQRFIPLLQRGLIDCGYNVTTVISQSHKPTSLYGEVLHRPPLHRFLSELSKCDLYLQHNFVSLYGWALLCKGARSVVVHHVVPEKYPFRAFMATSGVRHVAVSQFVQSCLALQSKVLYCGMDNSEFRNLHMHRRRDILFVGRLCWSKGWSTLLEALRILHQRGNLITGTFLGSGGGLAELQAQIFRHGLSPYISCPGAIFGEELLEYYNTHKLVVIPSLDGEPFGLVALEALACGCRVIAHQDGGLPEALGRHATFVPHESPELLADTIEKQIKNYSPLNQEEEQSIALHLDQFSIEACINNYAAFFESILRRCS